MDFNTIGVDQLTGWTEKTLQSTSHSQTCTKKRSCLVVCCLFDPLQLPESLRNITSEKYAQQIDEMNRNGNACSQQWSERAQFSTTMPDCTPHNQCFNSWKNWAIKLYLTCHSRLISRQRTTTSSSIFTTFYRENASTVRRRQKMLSKSSSNPEALIFMLWF